MELSVDGMRALVTGASGGLGAHFAKVLAENGAAVTLGARRQNSLESVVTDIESAGGTAQAIALDLTGTSSVTAAFADKPFDIVVNNAGVTGTVAAMDISEEDWDRQIDTSLKGSFLVAQAADRALRDKN